MDEQIRQRINLLQEGSVISKESADQVCNILRYLEQDEIVITEDNAAAFVTHLCMALEREKRQDHINALSSDAVKEIRQSAFYPHAQDILRRMLEAGMQLSSTEQDYICLHLEVLLESQNEGN